MKTVFKAEFEGDLFEVLMQTGDLYHWRQKSGDETVVHGSEKMLSLAIEAIFKRVNSWAIDIDTGSTEAGGI